MIKYYLRLSLVFLAIGCATTPYDYSNFKKYKPKSILVLTPLNNTTDLKASYSCLSSVTRPLAEMGYYVFPVAVIDQLFKENGMPNAGEIHRASLKKIGEIINPDAVMYITIENYGTQFRLIDTNTDVSFKARLVETKTGTLLWSGTGYAAQSEGPLNGLVNRVVSSALNNSDGLSKVLCRNANEMLFKNKKNGLLFGPYYRKIN